MLSGLSAVADAVSATLSEFEGTRVAGEADKVLSSARLLPWRTLGEQFSILEDELRERILKISVASNFSAEKARVRRRPGNILPGCLPMANASLEADPALRALRFELVPKSGLTEEDFWRCYFWHVANIKCDLLNDFATANRMKRDAVLADEASLGGEGVPSPGPGASGAPVPAAAPVDDDMLDLDAEFERLVGGAD